MAFEVILQKFKGCRPGQRFGDGSQKDRKDMKLPNARDDNVLIASATAQQKKYDASRMTSFDENGKVKSKPKGHKGRSTSNDWAEFENVFADEFQGSDGRAKMGRFMTEVVGILMQYMGAEKDRSSKVLDFHHPHQLREMMDHCLDVDETPRDLEQILSDCKETLKYCVKTGHPRFLNQLSTGVDLIGVAGEWLIAASNTNMFTYEVAPVFTLMEDVILRRMRGLVGWEDGDGILAPGGAISNFYAMLAARHKAFPSIKTEGMTSLPPMVVFTSEQSHYSIKRAAALLGIGTDNVMYVKCDQRGRMLVDDLESKIKAAESVGKYPLFVNAMCGSTVLGAFDPVEDIADLCQTRDIWLHIDGAWGGSVLLSRTHRHLLNGIHRANSMTWNPHKMMGAPLQCSAVLLREKGLLLGANQMGADYLFQKDKHYDISYDTGDKSIQCGRHNDVFKLWLMWRAKGDAGFEKQIDHNFELAQYLLADLKKRDNFDVVIEEIQGPNVCFWYLTPEVKALPRGPERDKALNEVAPKIKAKMMETGLIMVTYQPLGKLPNFFRIAVSNPEMTTSDLKFVLDELERMGGEL